MVRDGERRGVNYTSRGGKTGTLRENIATISKKWEPKH
jgi:hypothetical protein